MDWSPPHHVTAVANDGDSSSSSEEEAEQNPPLFGPPPNAKFAGTCYDMKFTERWFRKHVQTLQRNLTHMPDMMFGSDLGPESYVESDILHISEDNASSPSPVSDLPGNEASKPSSSNAAASTSRNNDSSVPPSSLKRPEEMCREKKKEVSSARSSRTSSLSSLSEDESVECKSFFSEIFPPNRADEKRPEEKAEPGLYTDAPREHSSPGINFQSASIPTQDSGHTEGDSSSYLRSSGLEQELTDPSSLTQLSTIKESIAEACTIQSSEADHATHKEDDSEADLNESLSKGQEAGTFSTGVKVHIESDAKETSSKNTPSVRRTCDVFSGACGSPEISAANETFNSGLEAASSQPGRTSPGAGSDENKEARKKVNTKTAAEILSSPSESLSSSLEQVCELSRSCSHRRRYAQLRPDSMGVDLHHGPVTNLDNRSPQMVDSGAAGDGGGVPHIVAGEGQELYALPMKGPRAGGDGPPEPQVPQQHSGSFSSSASTTSSSSSSTGSPPADPQQELPPGWERHEDNDGPYYWHIKSGTITRTPPAPTSSRHPPPPPAHRRNKDEQMGVPRSTTSSALVELAELRPRSTNTPENAYKRRSYPVRSELTEAGCGRAVRFAVRSLGWLEVAEEELTPERSSRAVNRCIVDLSVGRRDVMDVVGCWGEGKDLFMDLDEGSLKLVDPENLTLLNSQPIHTIRVWGVGRDNGRERDFAYVARDRVSRKHMCHVFRCDTPARVIANTLRDICKKIMIERSLKGDLGSQLGSSNSLAGNNNNNNSVSSNNNNNNTSPLGRATRPSNLPTEHRRLQRHNSLMQGQSFPTPMEEPRKVVRAQYVGLLQVSRPSGMEVINRAIQDAVTSNPGPWDTVLVAVAPSTITISDAKDNSLITECRVRFLSFLGIGRNVHHCAFIMHNAQDQFVAHVFFCEPSSGALCKTIEAACKLRYQKCLDAHPSGGAGALGAGGRGGDQRGGVAATLRSVFTSLAGGRGRRGAAS